MTIVAAPVQAGKARSVPRTRQTIVARRGVPAVRPAQASRPGAAESIAITPGFPSLRLLAPTDAREAEATSFARRVVSARDRATEKATVDEASPASVDVTPVAAGPDTEVVDRPVTPAVAETLKHPSAGEPLDPDLAERIGQATGAPPGNIRVHADANANRAAKEIGARAFAFGPDIYLAQGESPLDAELIAHEIAHVLQSNGSAAIDLASANIFGDIVDWAVDKVVAFLNDFAPYRALCIVVGQDLLTGEDLHLGADKKIAELFRLVRLDAAAAVIEKLALFATIDEIATRKLREKNLTIGRIVRDIKDAVTSPSTAKDLIQRFISDVVDAFTEAGSEIVAHVRRVLGPYAREFLERNPRIAALWRVGTAVFGYDPIAGEAVDASVEQMLGDMMILVGQSDALERMRASGTLDSTIEWFEKKLVELGEIKSAISNLVSRAWDAISLGNLPQLPSAIMQLVDEAGGILERIELFAKDVAVKALVFLKDALLGLLSDYALKIPGFGVIRVIIGRDPFTGAKVPSEAIDFLREIVLLFSDQEAFDQLNESGKIQQAADTIDTAKKTLGISWDMVAKTIAGVWDLVTFASLLRPIDTFQQIVDQFGKPIARIWDFIVIVVREVVWVTLLAMGFPLDVLQHLIDNVITAVDDIRKDPIGFLKNVIKVLELGFTNFLDHIDTHLLAGLTAWLLRGVRSLGIEVPEKIDLQSAITLVLQVLGVSMEMLWTKIGARIGEDTVAALRAAPEMLDQVFSFVREIEEGGIGFLWEKLSEQLSALWDTVFDAAVAWITKIVAIKAGAKIVGYLAVPGLGQIIGGVDLVLSTLQSLIEYAADLVILLDGYVQTVVDTAKGNIAPGAEGVEKALANALPLAIGFLATFIGLGNLPEKIKEIILSVREIVEKAIDWLLDKAVALGRSVLDAIKGVLGGDEEGEGADDSPGALGGAIAEIDEEIAISGDKHRLLSDGPNDALRLHSTPTLLSQLEEFRELVVKFKTERDAELTKQAKDAVMGAVPADVKKSTKKNAAPGAPAKGEGTAGGANSKKSASAGPPPSKKPGGAKPSAAKATPGKAGATKQGTGKAGGGAAGSKAGSTSDAERAIIREIVRLLKSYGGVGALFSPGKSAPGIGSRAQHGQQPPRTRAVSEGVTHIISTESEHVIPFAVGTSLWTSLLQEGVKPRKGLANRDKAQTTIVIYYRAARLKTAGASSFDLAGAGTRLAKLYKEIDGGDLAAIAEAKATPPGEKTFSGKGVPKAKIEAEKTALQKAAESRLATHGSAAVDRTVVAIASEHKEKEVGAESTNGPRRGEKSPVPSKGDVVAAVEAQKKDLVVLLLGTFFGEELTMKGVADARK